MSLSKKIAAALDDMVACPGTPGVRAEVFDDPHGLALEVEVPSAVGVSCRCLEFTTAARRSWTIDELRAWGDRIAARVTYLMEPLLVVEADAEAVQVAMRSKSPTTRGDRRSFYEVRLNRDGSLRMERVVFDEATRQRQTTPFQLTREIVERLADDLVASVA
jgi:hypothetical protein